MIYICNIDKDILPKSMSLILLKAMKDGAGDDSGEESTLISTVMGPICLGVESYLCHSPL